MKHAFTFHLGIALAGWFVPAPFAGAQTNHLPSIPAGVIPIHLQAVATGLGAPDYAISAPGDSTRLFILEQKGLVLVLRNGAILPTPALDIQSRVSPPLNTTSATDERGLLGIAFHPGFNNPASPGHRTLYTYNSEPIPGGTSPTYAAPNGATQTFKNVVNEWKMSVGNPDVIDAGSRRELISFGKNAANHNGGTIAFGPDGYLYLGLGDGGNSNDVGASHIEPGGNAQNLATPLGKMLRLDPLAPALTPGSADAVSANGQYRIPATNPYQGAGQVPEIYASGLRNPYRFSFDRLNGQLVAADVGQGNIEEIDIITLGGNYGWAMKEGDFLFSRTTGIGARSPGIPAGLIDPVSGPGGTLEYDHQDGISITGGFVYRGAAIPELYGKYVFGDLALLRNNDGVRVDGRLFHADLSTGVINEFLLPQFATTYLPLSQTVHGFGEDGNGELHVLATNTAPNGTGGVLYAIKPSNPFSIWASSPAQGLSAWINDGPLDDPDFDGFRNLMEFVLGGGPMDSSQSIQPVMTVNGGNIVFEYDRSDASVPSITQDVEYSGDLVSWTSIPVSEAGGGAVVITPGSPADHVTVTIPPGTGKRFVRLKVRQ